MESMLLAMVVGSDQQLQEVLFAYGSGSQTIQHF